MNLAIVQMTCYSVSLQVGHMLLCMHRHLDWPQPMIQISSASEYWVLILFAVLLWCPMLAIMFLLSRTTHYWCRLRCSAISTFVHRRNLMKCLIHCNRAWTFICQGTPAGIFGLQFLSLFFVHAIADIMILNRCPIVHNLYYVPVLDKCT